MLSAGYIFTQALCTWELCLHTNFIEYMRMCVGLGSLLYNRLFNPNMNAEPWMQNATLQKQFDQTKMIKKYKRYDSFEKNVFTYTAFN